jgi:hypothetical protein
MYLKTTTRAGLGSHGIFSIPLPLLMRQQFWSLHLFYQQNYAFIMDLIGIHGLVILGNLCTIVLFFMSSFFWVHGQAFSVIAKSELSKCDVTSSNDQGGLTCKNKIVMVLTINNGWGVCFVFLSILEWQY